MAYVSKVEGHPDYDHPSYTQAVDRARSVADEVTVSERRAVRYGVYRRIKAMVDGKEQGEWVLVPSLTGLTDPNSPRYQKKP